MSDNNDIEARLRDVVASVFDIDPAAISDADAPDTIEGWDSANHINLMLSIEAEFEVAFEADEMADLASVGAIRQRLCEVLAVG